MRVALDSRNAVYAGIAAGVIATVVQLLLWWAFWDVLPAIFYRDVRLAAAILLGRTILPPPVSFDGLAFVAASVVHFSLSVVCSFILAAAIARRGMRTSLLIGAVFGLLLYVVNMYGFTHLFPWFEIARDWITLVTHVVFGLAAAGVYTLLTTARATARPARNAEASGA